MTLSLAATFWTTASTSLFSPPLLAGPVVRAKDMLPQVQADTKATPAMMSEGLFLIMTGLLKKVVIADYISGNFVDRIFDNPMLYSGFENLMGCIGFTIQLYCDFSGYSDMAIGPALLLGYRFKINFDAPFKSQSPSEFGIGGTFPCRHGSKITYIYPSAATAKVVPVPISINSPPW